MGICKSCIEFVDKKSRNVRSCIAVCIFNVYVCMCDSSDIYSLPQERGVKMEDKDYLKRYKPEVLKKLHYLRQLNLSAKSASIHINLT